MPMLLNPEAVFFDKDGTLIDIHHYWGTMIKLRANLICQRWYRNNSRKDEIRIQLMEVMGFDLENKRLKRDGPIGVKPRSSIVNIVGETLRANGQDLDVSSIEEVFLEIDAETEKDLSPLLRLLPGVRTLLMDLKRAGIPAFVLTTDITCRAKLAMKSLKIDG